MTYDSRELARFLHQENRKDIETIFNKLDSIGDNVSSLDKRVAVIEAKMPDISIVKNSTLRIDWKSIGQMIAWIILATAAALGGAKMILP